MLISTTILNMHQLQKKSWPLFWGLGKILPIHNFGFPDDIWLLRLRNKVVSTYMLYLQDQKSRPEIENYCHEAEKNSKIASSFRDNGVTKIWWQIFLHGFFCLSSTLCAKSNLHQWKLFIHDTWNIDFAFLEAKFYA